MTTKQDKIEHFCTLFDSNFLPLGMSLHQSLMAHAHPFHLWIICMDELVEKQLQILSLPQVTLISLREIETSELLAVKSTRSRGEYCWTITPFTFSNVFKIQPEIPRLTYLDADLFFFKNPQILLQELDESNRSILITEHAYAPEYDQTHTSGKFCVQFLTVKNNPEAMKVINWWQGKCLKWCFARLENGKFGDQKYLDSWLDLFPNHIWVLKQKENTLAPWNVRYFGEYFQEKLKPVFYHFHGLRIVDPKQIILYSGYRIGKYGMNLYEQYLQVLIQNIKIINKHNITTPHLPILVENLSIWNSVKYAIKRKIGFKIRYIRI